MGSFDHLEWTYDGAFEQLFGLERGEFEQKFSKNSNARGGMLKLRFDWYITLVWCGSLWPIVATIVVCFSFALIEFSLKRFLSLFDCFMPAALSRFS